MTLCDRQLYEIHHKIIKIATKQQEFLALHLFHYAVGLLSTFYLGQRNQTEQFLFFIVLLLFHFAKLP